MPDVCQPVDNWKQWFRGAVSNFWTQSRQNTELEIIHLRFRLKGENLGLNVGDPDES